MRLFLFIIFCVAQCTTIGQAFDRMTDSINPFVYLTIAISYIAGIGFSVASLFKFKQVKDNPQQNTIGTALTMLVLSAALIFLPGLYAPLGRTMFGQELYKQMIGEPDFHKLRKEKDIFKF